MRTARQATLLIVDDDAANIDMIYATLGDEYEIVFARNGQQCLELARTALPDVILLDVMMPGMDGYTVCTHLKADASTANIPVVFITGLGDVAAETRGLEAGAVDYVTKPISPAVVRLRVRNQIELKRAREQLQKLAITDGLTGLANRRHFDVRLDIEIRRLARSQAPLSLLMLDVDHFKLFNDAYGHVAGDQCLRQVASTLDDAVSRAPDLAARYGGEEFAAILPETDHEGAVALAERLRDRVAASGIPHRASLVAQHVTVSVGIVTVRCNALQMPSDLIALADAQLYRAKHEGRDRVAASDAARELGAR